MTTTNKEFTKYIELEKKIKKEESILSEINHIALEQAGTSDYDELVDLILEQLMSYTKPIFAVFNRYDSKKKVLVIKKIRSDKKILNKIVKLGGKKILNTETPVSNDLYEEMISTITAYRNSLIETTQGAISEKVAIRIQKMLGIDIFVGLAFVVSGELYGTLTLAFAKDKAQDASVDFLESFAHISGISLRRAQSEEKLLENERYLRNILSVIDEAIIRLDKNGKCLDVISGFSKNNKDLVGKSFISNLPLDTSKKFINAIKKSLKKNNLEVLEYRIQEDIEELWFEARIVPLKENEVIALIIDITERKGVEKKITSLSYNDQLTGLYNRRYLNEYIKYVDRENHYPISVIVADLNGLKLVNDTHGHIVGDKMLQRASQMLKDNCRGSDVVFRWGGDEFLVFLPETNESSAKAICERIMSKTEYVENVPVSMALGIATKTNLNEEMEDIFKKAENKMYSQKAKDSRVVQKIVVEALLGVLSEKSFETREHTYRMQKWGKKIAKRMRLSTLEIDRLELVILMHDIGKINIPEDILLSELALDEKNWDIIKTHPEIGYRIARSTENFAHIAEDIFSHHEKWDGSGYPRSLKGENIPLLARITSIVDAYDVMSQGRPYKKAMSKEQIIQEFENFAGKHFDPELTRIFVTILKERKGEITEK